MIADGERIIVHGHLNIGQTPVAGVALVDPLGAEFHVAMAGHGMAHDGEDLQIQLSVPVGALELWWPAIFLPVQADAMAGDRQPVLREFTETGDPISEPSESIGVSQLTRHQDGLDATLRLNGLTPGGIYTVWVVAVRGEGTFPGDIFGQRGSGFAVGQDGEATVDVSAELGDEGIDGFFFPEGCGGDCGFDSLTDPLGAVVGFEIAYHGQEPPGGAPPAWFEDFWTGDDSVCANPLGSLGTGLIPDQPHCPVYFAATHPS